MPPTSWSPPAYEQLYTRYDPQHRALWYLMRPTPRPCFTQQLLLDIHDCHRRLIEWVESGDPEAVPRYMVGASMVPRYFNLGGDLSLFLACIEGDDADQLRSYALRCVELVWLNANNLNVPALTTLSVVEGDAFGGGFEAALSCNVLIAEKRARFGLPEVLFNLIPGMGAYQLLARRIGPAHAERMILSGKSYSAEECHELGIVDLLAEDGHGAEVAQQFMREHRKRAAAYGALMRVRNELAPISREGLHKVVDVWVEAAMKLGDRDLALMRRLVHSQDRAHADALVSPSEPDNLIRLGA
jgi:DSF synthase